MPLLLRKVRSRFRPSRRVRRARARARRGRGWLPALLLLTVLSAGLLGFHGIEARLGDLAQQAALSRLNGQITREVNAVVQTVLETEAIDTQALMNPQLDSQGRVQAMTADYNAVNRMKSALTLQIQERLEGLDVIETRVPAGLLFSDSLLTGAGFDIPVKVFVTNAIQVDFLDEFAAAGINQTRWRLVAQVTVPARVAGVRRYLDTQVVTQVPVAETVVVGSVPQAYAAIGE